MNKREKVASKHIVNKMIKLSTMAAEASTYTYSLDGIFDKEFKYPSRFSII